MSATNKTNSNKELLDDIDQTIQELRQWKLQEKADLRRQLNENQKQKSTFQSGYDQDDDDELYNQVQAREDELQTKLKEIRSEMLKKTSLVQSYMSSKAKTIEVKLKLEQSLQRLERSQIKQIDIENPIDLIRYLSECKQSIIALENLQSSEDSQTLNLDQMRKEEQQLQLQETNLKNISQTLTKDFEDIDKDLDEIDDLYKLCGMK